ncbi:hypothetical protein SAMN05216236_1362 [Sedimentitalea nanhaiensis]|uniref:Transcription factor zinc-finger domain-containing protein n=2 Tax=Sedimentitalea nanhaiensis TaxID=999627 RepID=A0A1I7DVS5_9RHOB|nr:hypothetical protein SAMN05216236_1362 [Sedimentitalea nanhaiensis]
MVIELKEPGKEPRKNMNAKGRMMCPVCDVPLSMTDRQGVEIDFCPDCRGVWLDRGELDKIIERSASDIAPRRAPEPSGYDDDRGHGSGKHGGGYGKHGYRRKSWLHELFD